MKGELAALRQENETLRRIVIDLHWMARRYADGRSSYAAPTFNDHTRELLRLGVKLNGTADRTLWACDGMGRAFDRLTDEQATPGTPEALGATPGEHPAGGEGVTG